MRRVLTLSVVCCVLALAGCGPAHPANASESTPAATTVATPLPLPTLTPSPQITTLSSAGAPVAGPALAWSQAALPTGFGMQFHVSDIGVAPSDGEIAYACTSTLSQTSQTEVVVTHNGGLSWGPLTHLSVNFAGCSDATVDAATPTTALVYSGPNPTGTGALTTNGGSTWQAYAVPNAGIYSLATAGGSTYAILDSESDSSFSLAVSRDSMRTWQPISVPNGVGGSDVLGFWGPVAGSMLAETGTNGTFSLWQSSDGGAHWVGVPLPAAAASWIEAAPGPQPGSWRIYVEYDYQYVAYSTDEGARWTVLPSLESGVGPELSGIGNDGAVLAVENSTNPTLFRFVPGTTRWQSLGVLPKSAASIAYAPSPSGGILWAFPAESDGASGAGPANAVYSAPYPAN
jgi:hypothetical protein